MSNPNTEPEFWYRYADVNTSDGLCIMLREYQVLRHTPKGVWLNMPTGKDGKRFILRSARKRVACPTLEEAKKSFCARKKRQCFYAEAQAERARTAIKAIEHGKANAMGHILWTELDELETDLLNEN